MPYIIKKSTLTGIADAIRGKTGGTDKMNPVEMASAIEGISAGGGDIDALIDGSLTEITSNAESIHKYVFFGKPYLLKGVFPLCKVIYANAFESLQKLLSVDFSKLEELSGTNFKSCSNFKALILRMDSVPTMDSSVGITGTIASGTGYIYVPRALVDSYKSATNWSTFADQFRALEDYTVDGTITGELDETKI